MADPGAIDFMFPGAGVGNQGGQFAWIDAESSQWQPLITLATDSQSHELLEENDDHWPFLLLNPVTGALFLQAIAAVAVGVATLSKATTFAWTLAATAIGTASLTTAATFLKTLAVTVVGLATLTPQYITGGAGVTRVIRWAVRWKRGRGRGR